MIVSILTVLAGAIGGAITAGFFLLKSKKTEFENDYYKSLVEKRIQAYEDLNFLIQVLKGSVQDNDGKTFHEIFIDKEKFLSIIKFLRDKRINNFWYSDQTNDNQLEIYNLLIHASSKADYEQKKYSEIGKEFYKRIYTIRDKMELQIKKDFLDLYNIKKFLESKNIETNLVKRNLMGEYSELSEEEKDRL